MNCAVKKLLKTKPFSLPSVTSFFFIFSCSLFFLPAAQADAGQKSSSAFRQAPLPYQLVIVRHANRKDHNAHSALSKKGLKRANSLNTLLKEWQVEHVHSTCTIRSLQTGAPTAHAQDLRIKRYNNLRHVTNKVHQAGGKHLIVGHSNTVNPIVEAFGGKPGDELGENEYNRLYVLTRSCDGKTQTQQFRYPDQGKAIKKSLQHKIPSCN